MSFFEQQDEQLPEQITIVLLGFLTYGTKVKDESRTCDIVAAPHADAVPHKPVLVVDAGAIASLEGKLNIRLEKSAALINLDGLTVSLSDAGDGPATTVDFDHVPVFDTLVCGAEVDDKWRERSELQFDLKLAPGSLRAWPGLDRVCWGWRDCDGNYREQDIYAIATFQPTNMNARRFEFRSRAEGSVVASLILNDELKDESLLTFVANAPAAWFDEDESNDDPGLKVDLSHVEAMLTLHSIKGDLQVIFGRPCEGGQGAGRMSGLVNLLARRTAQFEPAWTSALLKMLQNGRPHCGGRQLSE